MRTAEAHLQPYRQIMLPALEDTLRAYVQAHIQPAELARMVAYHMGWEGLGAGPQAQGKRVRPLLTLLTAQAAGGDWKEALPAAAAVEFIHNFSLLHDDIQDGSRLRRGRPTVWHLWGIAQAINAGDALFALAFRVLDALPSDQSPAWPEGPTALLAAACLNLTRGQYLDLAYEGRADLDENAYWSMIEGKTAALLETAVALGAYAAGLDADTAQPYREFGRALGLAFQVWDDYLGIWGDPNRTGKSVASDLVARKNSLPVLYGLTQRDSAFAQRWRRGPIHEDEAPALAERLAETGARAYTRQQAEQWTARARAALAAAPVRDAQAHAALQALADALLHRDT